MKRPNLFLLTLLILIAREESYPQSRLPAGKERALQGPRSVIYVEGSKYRTPGEALKAASAGSTVLVPPGSYAQGATPIYLAGKILKCAVGATIIFHGLDPKDDAVTMGWSDGDQRTGIEGCVLQIAASGRDGIRVLGGNHWFIRDVDIQDFGRDCIHVEPDVSFHWSENWEISDFRCSILHTPSGSLRDALNFSIENPDVENVFINEGLIRTGNIRGYKRHAIHFLSDLHCPGCKISNLSFLDVHTDGQGKGGIENPAIYFEKGPAGGNRTIEMISFMGGGSEDTTIRPKGPIFEASGPNTLNGLFLWNFTNGAFPHMFDASLPGGATNIARVEAADTTLFAPLLWYRDGTGLQAAAAGLSCPPAVAGDDWHLCIFQGGAWNPRLDVLAEGGVKFDDRSGTAVAAVDNAGNLSGTSVALGGGLALRTSDQSGTGSLCMTTNCALTRPAINGIVGGDNQVLVIPGSLTTTAAASDNVSIPGVTGSSHCGLTPTNASAAKNLATTFLSSKESNQVTVSHIAKAGMKFDILCTAK
jgi:hypothetical protein